VIDRTRWKAGRRCAFFCSSKPETASRRAIIQTIARACAATDFSEKSLVSKISDALCDGKFSRWIRPLARDLEAEFRDHHRPREIEIVESISENLRFERALDSRKVVVTSVGVIESEAMRPSFGAPQSWTVPPATTLIDLASLLEIHPVDLGWVTSYNNTTQHYHYRWHRKRGTPAKRLIEIPKPLLKMAQSALLQNLLEAVPNHESSCAFQQGKSVFDFVNPHTNQEFSLKMDLKDFFPSITSGRVFRIFHALGYPETIAKILTRTCVNSTPSELLEKAGMPLADRHLFNSPHLPQGAPTSPALANLAAFRLDCRLAGLAKSEGANYTRYADDLLFSGDREFHRKAKRFHATVLAIIYDEGFLPNPRKTRFMPKSKRQRAAGLVFNEKPNVSRPEFDRLKAILSNCVRHDWESQNRESHPEFREHLLGRIQWVASSNPARGGKLRSIFEQVKW